MTAGQSYILVTTLGTGKYEEAPYKYGDKVYTEVYIQAAICRMLKETYGFVPENILILATEEAQKSHKESLQKRLQELNLPAQFVPIPKTNDASGVWEIFKIIYENVPAGKELILDITHAFRYMPMILAVMAPYLKLLKNVSVKGIYYGEFDREHKEASAIVDITSLASIQEWTLAVHDFANNGNATLLNNLAQKAVSPILKETKGKDDAAQNIKSIAKNLPEFTQFVEVCSSLELIKADFVKIREWIEKVKSDTVPVFYPLLQSIQKTIQDYQPNDLNNITHAIRYCIDKNKIQQGLTFAQEHIVSLLCRKIDEDYLDKEVRTIVSGFVSMINEKKDISQWKHKTNDKAREDAILNKLQQLGMKDYIQKEFNINNIRNAINHAGFNKDNPPKYSTSVEKLYQTFEALKKFSQDINVKVSMDVPSSEGYLLNISNHPFEKWSEIQKQAAIEQFGKVVDMPFPNIPPEYSTAQIYKMAEEYKSKIFEEHPNCKAIHIMGEFNFTFHFVSIIKEYIPCFASTTERKFEELSDGSRKLYFDFVQFRAY